MSYILVQTHYHRNQDCHPNLSRSCPQMSLCQVWDTNSWNWSNGSHWKLWQDMVKIQHWCEQILNVPSRGWQACKNWFFMLTTFLARGFFSIHDIWKKIKEWLEPNIFLDPKISSVIPVNHAKEFLKYVLYFHTFLLELQIAPITPILETSVRNLVQGYLRTWSWQIWVTPLILILVGLH